MEMGPMHGAEGEAEGACCLFYTVLYGLCILYTLGTVCKHRSAGFCLSGLCYKANRGR